MAERILAKGHSPTVFDIDRGALDRVVQRGARQAHSAGAAVSDITITLLPSSVEVRQAVLGENGVLSSLRPASTVIDLSGTDPDCARELEERCGKTPLHRRDDSRQRRAGRGDSKAFSIVIGGETSRRDFPDEVANGYLFARAVDAEGFQDRDHPICDGE